MFSPLHKPSVPSEQRPLGKAEVTRQSTCPQLTLWRATHPTEMPPAPDSHIREQAWPLQRLVCRRCSGQARKPARKAPLRPTELPKALLPPLQPAALPVTSTASFRLALTSPQLPHNCQANSEPLYTDPWTHLQTPAIKEHFTAYLSGLEQGCQVHPVVPKGHSDQEPPPPLGKRAQHTH